jgi:hypothetical protein
MFFKVKLVYALLALVSLCGCEPVDTPDSVMFSTQNTKLESVQQQS